MMKYDYETLDIDGVEIADAISMLQEWVDENPEAAKAVINLGSDGDSTYLEVSFERPYTETELEFQKTQAANYAAYQEERDRTEYERLKAKYEGN
jgi:hypothetical protein